MALKKSIGTQFGIPATYWRITTLTINHVAQQCDVTLHGYSSQAARDGGAQPLAVRTYHFAADENSGFDHEANNTAVAYEKIREHGDTRSYDEDGALVSGKEGEFADAQDV